MAKQDLENLEAITKKSPTSKLNSSFVTERANLEVAIGNYKEKYSK